MLSRLAMIVLSLLLSVNAAAQRIAPAILVDAQRPSVDRILSIQVDSSLAGKAGQVVPLWASPDGRLLAIVALSRDAGGPTLPPSPAFGGISDLRIVDATDLFSAGLRMRLGRDFHADMTIGQLISSPFSADFSRSSNCALGTCFGGDGSLNDVGAFSASLGLGWSPVSGNGPDLSFGLSWLESRNAQLPLFAGSALTANPIDLALAVVPGAVDYRLQSSRTLSARGVWQLAEGPVFDLTAALGRAELSPVWYGFAGSGLELDQASLGIGLASGSLRGSIVGRISSLDEPAQMGARRWGGLDLGLSWRTPWRGEVTVGAQNVWSAKVDSAAAGDAADASQARMPYVQYRQDL